MIQEYAKKNLKSFHFFGGTSKVVILQLFNFYQLFLTDNDTMQQKYVERNYFTDFISDFYATNKHITK